MHTCCRPAQARAVPAVLHPEACRNSADARFGLQLRISLSREPQSLPPIGPKIVAVIVRAIGYLGSCEILAIATARTFPTQTVLQHSYVFIAKHKCMSGLVLRRISGRVLQRKQTPISQKKTLRQV